MQTPRRRKSRRWIYLGIIAVLIAAFVGYGQYKKKEGEVKQVLYDQISQGPIVETISASGSITSRDMVDIAPDVSGEVVELLVQPGDTVSLGQIVARIRPDNYQSMADRATAQYNAQRATEAQALSQIEQAQIRLAKAETDYNRNKGLADKNVITQAELETFANTLNLARQDLAVAKQNQRSARFTGESAQAAVRDANENLRKTVVRSPLSGVVVKVPIELGERVVGTTQMAGTTMMTIANMKALQAIVNVNENDILKINKGDTAIVSVDAENNAKIKGRVSSIALLNNTKTGTDAITEYEVKIDLSSGGTGQDTLARLKNGMTISCEIITARRDAAVRAPISSVVYVVTDSSRVKNGGQAVGKQVVFIDSAGQARYREVETGISDFTYIEIVKGGKAGQKIIAGPYELITKNLRVGDKVKVKGGDGGPPR